MPTSLVGDGKADDTAALREIVARSRNGRLLLPAGAFRITSPIAPDPAFSYSISGQGSGPWGAAGTTIVNAGPGPAFIFANQGRSNDNAFLLADLAIVGTAASGGGIVGKNVHRLQLERLWIERVGDHGVHLFDAWVSKISGITVTHAGGDGVRIERRGNLVSLRDSTFTGNGRKAGANIRFTGAPGAESLAVTIQSCDFSSAAQGLILEHIWSASVLGCYSESCPLLIQATPTVRGLVFAGNYLQDGVALFDRVGELDLSGNTLNAYSKPTELRLRLTHGSRVAPSNLQHGARQVVIP